MAGIELVYFLYEYDQKKEASDLLKTLNLFYKKGKLLSVLLAFQAGTYWMNQGEHTAALEYFQKIKEDPRARWIWPDIFIKMGLIYEHLKQWDQAQLIYQKIQNDFLDSQSASRAEQYLNWLTVKGHLTGKSSAPKADE